MNASSPPAAAATTVVHHHHRRPESPAPVVVIPSHTPVPAPANTHGPADPTPETFIGTSTGVGARPTKEVFIEVQETPTTVRIPATPEPKVKVVHKVTQGKKVGVKPVVEKETVYETVYEPRTRGGVPQPPPAPPSDHGKGGPRTYRKWYEAKW